MTALGRIALFGAIAVVIGGSPASAQQDVTHYTLSCDTLAKNKFSFAPGLRSGGASPETARIKGTLSGCFATPDGGNPPITVISGAVSGTLTTSTNDCAAILGPSTATGTITIRWKTSPAIMPSTTTMTISAGNVSGGNVTPFGDAATYGVFIISGATVGGAFLGSDNGASSFLKAVTLQGVNALSGCTTGGLKGANFGPTELVLR